MKQAIIRNAKENEVALVLEFIKGIAHYEKMLDQVVATEESLYHALFIERSCQVVIAFLDEIPAGFALYFYNFSTFMGKKGLYLEDLFVKPEFRKLGIGKQLMFYLIELAKTKKCGRMEWTCLDWNTPSIAFYESLGAVPMNGWTIFRLTEEKLSISMSKPLD